MQRSHLLGRAVLATALVVVSVTAMSPGHPVFANENELILPGGGPSVTLGPNHVLRIDGQLTYSNSCDADGVNDFVYPATDVYLMPSWYMPSEGAPLQDVLDSPNTIVSGLSMFVEEIIAITQPSGSLPEGTYHIVFDTCQDGRYNAISDTIFENAVHVEFPFDMPPVDPAIQALKSNSYTQFGSWQAVGAQFDRLLKVQSTVGNMSCVVGDVRACLGLLQTWVSDPTIAFFAQEVGLVAQSWDCSQRDNLSACFAVLQHFIGQPPGFSPNAHVMGGAKSLIANMAKSHFAIYADPPRHDYHLASSAQVSTGLPVWPLYGDNWFTDAVSDLVGPLERNEQLVAAFLAAAERIQGAQADGELAHALAQARSERNLAALIPAAQASTADALDTLAATIGAELATADAEAWDAFWTWAGWLYGGLPSDALHTLRNDGLDGAARAAVVDEASAGFRSGFSSSSVASLISALELLADQQAASAGAYGDAVDELDALIAALEAELGAAVAPVVDAGGPYGPVGVGVPVALTATASDGATVTWDLDGDGAFGDEALFGDTTTTVTATFLMPGQRVVAVAAERDGVMVTDHALVTVTDTNAIPTVARTPDLDTISVTEGDTQAFSVAVDDDDPAEAITITWLVDGTEAGTGPELAYTADGLGAHTIEAAVEDAAPYHQVRATWVVDVSAPDADGDGWHDVPTADCDDTDPLVNPGRREQVGNGKDDDCNAATTDQPADLGPGATVWGWGWIGDRLPRDLATTTGDQRLDRVVTTSITNNQVNVLLNDGTVVAWNINGGWLRRPPGDTTHLNLPGLLAGAGGFGVLEGVVALSATDSTNFALLADGRVVSWGSDAGAGMLGSGVLNSGVRLYPDYVLDGDGRPIENVVALASAGSGFYGGNTTMYAIQESAPGDHGILQWGEQDCSGRNLPLGINGAQAQATLNTHLTDLQAEVGAPIVQIEADREVALIRFADGSVYACGDIRRAGGSQYDDRARPFAQCNAPNANEEVVCEPSPFGPGNPAIDVAVSSVNNWFVVDANGDVWLKTWIGSTEVDNHTSVDGAPFARNNLQRLWLPPGAPVVDIQAGSAEDVLIRRADGTALTWGFDVPNRPGSLGRPLPDPNTPTARGCPSDDARFDRVDWYCPGPIDVGGGAVVGADMLWYGLALVVPDLEEAEAFSPTPYVWNTVDAVAASGAEYEQAEVEVQLSRPAAGEVEVDWTFAGETGTVTIPTGETSAVVQVTLPGDGLWGSPDVELPFQILGVNQNSDVVIGVASAPVTVIDADLEPDLGLVETDVVEGNAGTTAAHVAVALSHPAAIPLDVTVATADVTATAGADYAAVDVTVTIAPGETTASVPLAVLGDRTPEPDETFTATGSLTRDGDPLDTDTAVVTIGDDDPLALTAGSDRVRAGTPAQVALRVPRVPTGESVQVAWATVEGSAKPGVDYVAGSGTVTVTGNAQGVGIASITITTLNSGGGEAALSLLVALTPTSTTGRTILGDERVAVSIDRPASTPPSSPAPPSTPAPTPTIPTPPDAPFPPSRYVPLSPARLFDTRPDHPGAGPKGLVGPDSSIDIQATGRLGVPDNAVAVVLNVTVTETTAASHVTVYPTGTQQPLASSINNIRPGQTRPNLVTVPVGHDGRITLYSLAPAHLLADVAGYYLATDHPVAAGRFIPLTPQRIFDTRPGTPAPGHKGRLAPTETVRVQVAGAGDIPVAGVAAVVVNLTGADATAAGFITAYPTGQDLPLASNVNLSGPGDTAPNLAIVPLGPDGAINIYSSHGTHALGDVTGYITDSTATTSTTGLFVPLHPTRVFDTRDAETPPGPKGRIPADTTIDVHVAGVAGIPTTATGAVLNIVGIQSPVGHLTIWPTGLTQPLASTLNFSTQPLDTRANAAMLPLGAGGQMTIYTLHGGHVLADTTGYFL